MLQRAFTLPVEFHVALPGRRERKRCSFIWHNYFLFSSCLSFLFLMQVYMLTSLVLFKTLCVVFAEGGEQKCFISHTISCDYPFCLSVFSFIVSAAFMFSDTYFIFIRNEPKGDGVAALDMIFSVKMKHHNYSF